MARRPSLSSRLPARQLDHVELDRLVEGGRRYWSMRENCADGGARSFRSPSATMTCRSMSSTDIAQCAGFSRGSASSARRERGGVFEPRFRRGWLARRPNQSFGRPCVSERPIPGSRATPSSSPIENRGASATFERDVEHGRSSSPGPAEKASKGVGDRLQETAQPGATSDQAIEAGCRPGSRLSLRDPRVRPAFDDRIDRAGLTLAAQDPAPAPRPGWIIKCE